MGCPKIYTKMELVEAQRLCECFIPEADIKDKDTSWFNGDTATPETVHKSIEQLEEELLKTKELFTNKEAFAFWCGIACKDALVQADEDGCDAMNASAASLSEFLDLLGVADGFKHATDHIIGMVEQMKEQKND